MKYSKCRFCDEPLTTTLLDLGTSPAKGNTLLNYCNIGSDIIPYTVDKSPRKQGYFLPGTHIPIKDPEKILKTKPVGILNFLRKE